MKIPELIVPTSLGVFSDKTAGKFTSSVPFFLFFFLPNDPRFLRVYLTRISTGSVPRRMGRGISFRDILLWDTMGCHEFWITRARCCRESWNKATHPRDECGGGKAQSLASYGVRPDAHRSYFVRRRNMDRCSFRNVEWYCFLFSSKKISEKETEEREFQKTQNLETMSIMIGVEFRLFVSEKCWKLLVIFKFSWTW